MTLQVPVPRLWTPSLKSGYARNAGESANPGLFKGMSDSWNPNMGVRGIPTVRNVIGTEPLDFSGLGVTLKTRGGMLGITHPTGGSGTVLSGSAYKQPWTGGAFSLVHVFSRDDTGWDSFRFLLDVDAGGAVDEIFQLWSFGTDGLLIRSNDDTDVLIFSETVPNGFVTNGDRITVVFSIDHNQGQAKLLVENASGGRYRAEDNALGSNGLNVGFSDVTFGSFNDNMSVHHQLSFWDRALSWGEVEQLGSDPLAPFRLRPRFVASPIPVATIQKSVIPRLWTPSIKSGYARNASESANPELWRGMWLCYAPMLGNTGDLRAYAGLDLNIAQGVASSWVNPPSISTDTSFSNYANPISTAHTNTPDDTTGITLLWHVRSEGTSDGTFSPSHRFTPNIGTVGYGFSAGTVQCNFGSSQLVGEDAAANTNYSMVMSVSPADVHIGWVNGKRVGENTSDQGAWTVTRFRTSTAGLNTWGVHIAWNRALSESDLKLLSVDPLAPFRLRPRFVASPTPVAISVAGRSIQVNQAINRASFF